MSDIIDILNQINDIVWLVPFFLIIALGIVSTIVFKGVQFRKIPEMVRVTFSNVGKKDKTDSAFRIFCVSMASRIGVGNITGPVVAIIVGGPGAIFWIWVFALIGSATAFVESIIGQLYKKKGKDGFFKGGPPYYADHALNWKKVAVAIAFLLTLLNIMAFTSIQASAASSSLISAFSFEGNEIVFAAILAVVTFFIVVGGFKRISDISAAIVPFAALAWILLCILAIIANGNVVGAFQMIFGYAFSVPAVIGGGIGTILLIAMKRSIFSNEAGLGKSVCVSSTADVKHPVFQGYTQALGVLVDMVVLTFTALVVLSFSGYSPETAVGMQSMTLVHQAFGPLLGTAAPIVVTIFVLLFSISTIYGDYFIGKVSLDYLTDKKVWLYLSYVVVSASVFLAALYHNDSVFVIGDILMAFVAAINCVCVFCLFKRVIELYKDFNRQKKEGIKEPEFHKSSLEGDTEGITEWD